MKTLTKQTEEPFDITILLQELEITEDSELFIVNERLEEIKNKEEDINKIEPLKL